MGAIELGAEYQIFSADESTYFDLNNPNDPNFVGYVDDITGLDSPGIRENAQVKSAGMGGYHGPFWADRRPWSVSGTIMPVFPVIARSAAQEKIQSIMMTALQNDALMQWLPSDGHWRGVYFRNQQPFRSTKGQSNVNRTFMISGVAADWRLYGSTIYNQSATGPFTQVSFAGDPRSDNILANNIGDCDSPPIFNITGPINGPYIYNQTTQVGFYIKIQLSDFDSLLVDFSQTYPVVQYNGIFGILDFTGGVDPGLSNWDISVSPGATNIFQLHELGPRNAGWPVANNGNTSMNVTWQDTWI